jgi:hypothetical protein
MIVDGYRLTSFEETMTTVMPEYNQLMNDCWAKNPNDRPTFEHIGQTLRAALPKVKQFQRISMKRHSSTTTNTADIQEEHSILLRLESRLSTDTPKSFNPNV